MKVALVQESVDRSRGGAETSTLEMAEALAAQGAEVELLYAASESDGNASRTAAAGAPIRKPGATPGLTLVGLPVAGRGKLQRLRTYFDAVTAYRATTRFDVVHAVVPYPHADVYQPRGGTYPETIRRTLAIVRNPLWRAVKGLGRRLNARQQFLLRCEQALLNRADPPRVACVSAYVKRQIAHDYPRVADRAVVVFNGVTPPRLDPAAGDALRTKLGLPPRTDAPQRSGPGVLLFLAHNFRLKGLGELLETLAEMQDKTPHLIVAGRDRAAPYEARAARLGLSPRVHFVGPQPAGALLAAADALVHPTWYDPCSRVVLESLAAGVPVITTKWNGASEAIAEGVDGFNVPDPRSWGAMVVGIAMLLSADWRAFARAKRAEKPPFEWTMQRHARELLALYRTITPR
jgi:UDP-glucose:(heptosyl)LPS alpha-1,3-glucosyltransferase